MCICVNCHYVDRCVTYNAVETQHQQLHLTETPD
ncbi:MAG: Ycf34 family protein, partial [Dolichospermum sp.]